LQAGEVFSFQPVGLPLLCGIVVANGLAQLTSHPGLRECYLEIGIGAKLSSVRLSGYEADCIRGWEGSYWRSPTICKQRANARRIGADWPDLGMIRREFRGTEAVLNA
jgi:hypothetical protein